MYGLPDYNHEMFTVWDGIYHVLLSGLTSIMPYADQLRAGSMRAFFHNWEALISPVLDMVGLFGNAVFFPPQKLPYEDHFEFCTCKMLFSSKMERTKDARASDWHP